MVKHRACPGVQHRQASETAAQVARIVGQFLQRRYGTAHEQRINFFLVRARQPAQLAGECESEQVIGARQQAGALLLQPALGLAAVTLGAVAIAAGVIPPSGIDLLSAVITLFQVTSKVGRATRCNILQGPNLRRQQAISEACAIGRTMEAENIGHLQHVDLWFAVRGLASVG